MGCDIHAFVEVKKEGKWLNLSELNIGRNYWLFAKMANVRNYEDDEGELGITPLAEPRGLPDDISEIVKCESDNWNSDGHSHSWLSKEEFQDLRKWIGEKFKKDTWETIRQFGYKIADIEEYPQYQDVRLVFWFDN